MIDGDGLSLARRGPGLADNRNSLRSGRLSPVGPGPVALRDSSASVRWAAGR